MPKFLGPLFRGPYLWENMACLDCTQVCPSTMYVCVGGGGRSFAFLSKESLCKCLFSPVESKALASDLMRVLSEGTEHTRGLF